MNVESLYGRGCVAGFPSLSGSTKGQTAFTIRFGRVLLLSKIIPRRDGTLTKWFEATIGAKQFDCWDSVADRATAVCTSGATSDTENV